jgi:hypothetical protein
LNYLANFRFPRTPPPPPPCRHCRHRSRTPSMPPPPFQDPAQLGHREELWEPLSAKLPSPSPSGKRLHMGRHLWPPSTLGFTTTGSAQASRNSTSSLTPPSTSEPCYHRRQPPAGPCSHGEPFLVSFCFPPTLICASPHRPSSPATTTAVNWHVN